MQKAVVIVPTYNEKGNIGKLLVSILRIFKGIKHFDMHVLVVDDSSPDGTGDIVKNYSKEHKNIHLLTGKKEGLGVAYIRGFKYAINELKADIVFQMDADFSHNPQLIPEFLNEIENGYDLVVGSRYIKGGGTPDWNLQRRIISRSGNFFARVVGGLWKVHDCTNGYRAIRTSILKKLDFKNLHTKGYAFLSTLLYELLAHGARVKEIPILFYDRKFGETKLNKKDIIEFFFNSFRLRFKGSKRFIKFCIVGASGTFVNMFFLWFFTEIVGFYYLASSPIAIELSIITNFILNNYWTFRDVNNKSHSLIKFLKYNLTTGIGLILNLSILFTLTTYFNVYYMVSNLFGILAAMAWNYLSSVVWTWKNDR